MGTEIMRRGQTFSSVYLAKIGKNMNRQKEKHMGDKMININQTFADDVPVIGYCLPRMSCSFSDLHFSGLYVFQESINLIYQRLFN